MSLFLSKGIDAEIAETICRGCYESLNAQWPWWNPDGSVAVFKDFETLLWQMTMLPTIARCFSKISLIDDDVTTDYCLLLVGVNYIYRNRIIEYRWIVPFENYQKIDRYQNFDFCGFIGDFLDLLVIFWTYQGNIGDFIGTDVIIENSRKIIKRIAIGKNDFSLTPTYCTLPTDGASQRSDWWRPQLDKPYQIL